MGIGVFNKKYIHTASELVDMLTKLKRPQSTKPIQINKPPHNEEKTKPQRLQRPKQRTPNKDTARGTHDVEQPFVTVLTVTKKAKNIM